MPATVHVVARFTAKAGQEDALKAVLIALVPPTRRELGCYQYDLLVSANDARQFCIVERWDGNPALDQHLLSPHVKKMLGQIEELVEGPPEIQRFSLV